MTLRTAKGHLARQRVAIRRAIGQLDADSDALEGGGPRQSIKKQRKSIKRQKTALMQQQLRQGF